MTSYSLPARKLNNRGRPSGGLVSFVELALHSSVFKLNNHYLAVRVDSCVYISPYLPTNYSNDQSEQLFALSCKRLDSCVEKFSV